MPPTTKPQVVPTCTFQATESCKRQILYPRRVQRQEPTQPHSPTSRTTTNHLRTNTPHSPSKRRTIVDADTPSYPMIVPYFTYSRPWTLTRDATSSTPRPFTRISFLLPSHPSPPVRPNRVLTSLIYRRRKSCGRECEVVHRGRVRSRLPTTYRNDVPPNTKHLQNRRRNNTEGDISDIW
jgi:hypothetical protein